MQAKIFARAVLGLWFLLAASLWAAEPAPNTTTTTPPGASLESEWGIQISSLRLSAHGYMVDFRYKVLDPDKALRLANRDIKPVLVDQVTGAKLLVPRTPKLGPLRQTAQKLTAGRIYFVLFANPRQVVKSGSQVAVAIGDFRAEDLTVE